MNNLVQLDRTAYLVVYVDTKSLAVVGAAIHSEPALSLTCVGGSEVALDVYSCAGRDFDESQRRLRECLAVEQHFRWILPLLPERR